MELQEHMSATTDQVVRNVLELGDSPEARSWGEASANTMIELLASGRLDRYESTLVVCAESVIEYGLPDEARGSAAAVLHQALTLAGQDLASGHPLASAFAQIPKSIDARFEPVDSGAGGEGGDQDPDPKPDPKAAKGGDKDPDPKPTTKAAKGGTKKQASGGGKS